MLEHNEHNSQNLALEIPPSISLLINVTIVRGLK
jgi:hypothetical protein